MSLFRWQNDMRHGEKGKMHKETKKEMVEEEEEGEGEEEAEEAEDGVEGEEIVTTAASFNPSISHRGPQNALMLTNLN